MSFIQQVILSYLLLYKYTLLFSVTFLAAFALPVPSASTLMAAAAFSSQGYFNIVFVFIIASLGNILGDNFGYWLARLYGKPVLYYIGLGKTVDSEVFRAVERRINHRPGLIIFFSRFEVIATLSVNIISGLGKMPYFRFLPYEIIGEVAQVFMYGGIGYFFGNNWQSINDSIGQFWLIITPTAALLIFLFWKKIFRWIIKF